MPLDWTLVTPEALYGLELENLLHHVESRRCVEFTQELANLRNQADRWSLAEAACLEFAVQATGMRLRYDQPSEPFGPMFQMGNGRSAIPADFPKDVLVAAYPWATALKDDELRARFLDTIWVQGKHFMAAKDAVTAYLASAKRLLAPKHWTDFAQRLERALRLAASLGKGGAELHEAALAEALYVVSTYAGADPLYLTMRLTQLLLEFRHGDPSELAKYAATVAQAAESSGDFWRAKDYFNTAADCCRAAQLTDEEAAHRRAAAESLVKEADAARGQPGRGAMVAASVLSSAVQAMRQAPGGKARAKELARQLVAVQEEALSELKSVSTSVDATEMVQAAVRRVSGKSFGDAMLAFCQLAKPPSLDALMRQVEQQASVQVLGSLMPAEVVNSRGRVVAKVSSLEQGSTDLSLPGLRWRMFRCAGMNRSMVVQAAIEPARSTILHEHAPDRADVLELIRHSPWIPEGHHESIARAIVAGFHGDMLLVGHVVPLQFEAVIRQAVEFNCAPDPMLKPDGTQEERTLSALLDSPQAESAFGSAGVLELQDLLTDQLGSNLRNEVAHGLETDGGFFSTEFVYAWWLLLRCVALSAHIVRTRQHDAALPPAGPADQTGNS